MRGFAGGGSREGDEELKLFLRRRRSDLIASLGKNGSRNGTGLIKNTSSELVTKGKFRTDDLPDAETGKHDYDWLLTPPDTPILPPPNSGENRPTSAAQTNGGTIKSASVSRASRLSAMEESTGEIVRSSSASRRSLKSFLSPGIRAPTSSSAVLDHRRNLWTDQQKQLSAAEEPEIGHSSGPIVRSNSANRRSLKSALSSGIVSLASRAPTSSTLASRPRSSNPPRTRPAPQNPTPISAIPCPSRPSSAPRSPAPPPRRSMASARLEFPGFSHDAPPNLRTNVPERPASAGRTRPGMPLMARACSNAEALPSATASGRSQISPSLFNRSKKLPEIQKMAGAPEPSFAGGTISKISLDIAQKYLDVKLGVGEMRAHSLFPNVRLRNVPKSRSSRVALEPIVPLPDDDLLSGAKGGPCNRGFVGPSPEPFRRRN